MNVALITNFNIPEKATAAIAVAKKLGTLGCTVNTASFNRDRILRQRFPEVPGCITYLPPERLYSASEMIVLLGGDGTILEAARRAVPAKKPMLGFNLGRLGYMAELEINEIERLDDVVAGNYRIEDRMLLKIEIIGNDGKTRFVSFALNEAVVSNGSVARMVELMLYEGGSEVSYFRADGLIVATPTGSTAYSMSAGGAVVDPRVDCMCVTPICPHSLTSRPMIFRDNAIIEIKNVCQREKVLFMTIDGKSNHEISLGETIRITKSDMTAKLVRLKNNSFYTKLRQKMNTNI